MRHMKKRVLRGSVCGIAVLLWVMWGVMPALAAQNLKLAHMFAPDSLPGKSAVKFADLVSEKTKGAIKITVLPGAALGDERANVEQLQNGSIDLALTGDLLISVLAKPYMLVMMPFIYRDVDHALHVFNGEIGSQINKSLLDNNIRVMAWQYFGTRELTANKPVRSLNDMKGLKLRLAPAPVYVKAWEKTGVSTVTVAFTELHLALQTGTVDAQENPPTFIINNKFNEVQKYLMLTDHTPQMQVFSMSNACSQSLSATDRAAIEAAAKETVEWTTKTAKESQSKDIEWLTTKGGMTLVRPDFSGLQELIKAVPDELMGSAGPALYNRIRAVR